MSVVSEWKLSLFSVSISCQDYAKCKWNSLQCIINHFPCKNLTFSDTCRVLPVRAAELKKAYCDCKSHASQTPPLQFSI